VSDICDRLRAAENRLLTVAGEDGTNGKLGTLRKEFDAEKAGRSRWTIALATIAIPALIAGAGALYVTGTRDGDAVRVLETVRAESARLQQQVDELSSALASQRVELATLRAMTLAPSRRNGGK
jgi:hypothetical protein